MSKLEFRCECGKKPAHIEGATDLWWLFYQALDWQHRRWNKQIKYVAVCPDVYCECSRIVFNGTPSEDLVRHLEMWQPAMPLLVREWHNCRYWLTEKQWQAKRYPKGGVPSAPLPRDTRQ